MSDNIQKLLRKTSFRKATQELSMVELQKLLSNVQETVEERAAEEAERFEADQARQQSITDVRKAMAAAGISLDELQGSLGGVKAKKEKVTVAPKYQVKAADGNVVQWTGRGRTPKVFQEYFDNGGSKESCLI
ncbi:MAG: DNA-binding protein H-NS [Motiliproteus sp.]|jgi:DNA-binding protein H-NS